jgi:hypothetical protein
VGRKAGGPNGESGWHPTAGSANSENRTANGCQPPTPQVGPDVFTYKATVSVTNNAGAAASLSPSGTGLNN